MSAEQTKSNKDTAAFSAALNRIDQSSPFGSIKYTQNGTDPTTGAPIYSQSTTLSEPLQAAFDRLPTEAFNAGDINTDDIRKRSFDSQLAQLTPEFDKGWTNLETTMSDRGLPIGSEIWNNQNADYSRAKDSSLIAASRQADQDASNEFQRQYTNKQNEYMMPYQQFSSMMGSQSMPFNAVPQSASAGTDVSGNIWNAYKADSQNAANANNQMFGGLLGLGSLAMNPASAFGYKLWG